METRNIEKLKSTIVNLICSVKTINSIVGIIFFFVWSDIVIEILSSLPIFLLLVVGLFSPITLLIGIVQYKNRKAYMTVIAIFVFSILINIISLPYYVGAMWNENIGEFVMYSFCPLCEIQDKLLIIIISLEAISLMHNRRMVELYRWEANLFYKTVIGVLLLLIALYLWIWITS